MEVYAGSMLFGKHIFFLVGSGPPSVCILKGSLLLQVWCPVDSG